MCGRGNLGAAAASKVPKHLLRIGARIPFGAMDRCVCIRLWQIFACPLNTKMALCCILRPHWLACRYLHVSKGSHGHQQKSGAPSASHLVRTGSHLP